MVATCGDGIQQDSEQCDDGNQNPNDACQTTAQRLVVVMQSLKGTEAHDGNLDDDDDCTRCFELAVVMALFVQYRSLR